MTASPRPLARLLALPFALAAMAAHADAPPPNPFARDAAGIEQLIDENYAYLDRLPGGALPLTDVLRAQAAAVVDERGLLRYAERALLLMADHHAITGSALGDSWAIVPSYADLWVTFERGRYVVDAVRADSPAARAGLHAGDALVAVDGVPVDQAVRDFWRDLGLRTVAGREAFAARVLAAGRRDRPRRLAVAAPDGEPRSVVLPSVYAASRSMPPHGALTATPTAAGLRVRLHDSLGDDGTIAAFDAAIATAPAWAPVVVDLRDTPSGGNTVVARAILGWFVDKPTPYQVHNLPREARQTGIGRQWIEEVLPRGADRHHAGPVVVCVGRWTGSMGEGLAVAFAALGARVVGTPMAGLLGAVDDYELPGSKLILKLPTERLSAVDGTPREAFRPLPPTTDDGRLARLCDGD